MKTRIFVYKDHIGIAAGDKLVNDPSSPGQLGCIVDLSEVEISKEALDALKTVKKSTSSLGEVMCFGNTFGWMGGVKYVFKAQELTADRDYEPKLLEKCIADIEVPVDFREFIDSIVK